MSDERLLAEAAEGILGELDGEPSDAWRSLQDNGWVGVAVAPSAGGQGGTLVEATALARAVGKTAAPAPVVEAIGAAWLAGAADSQDARLERVVRGETRATYIPRLLELEAGADASRLGGGPWPTPWARHSDAILGVARVGEGALRLVYLEPERVEISEGANIAGEPRDRVGLSGGVPADCEIPLRCAEDELLATLGLLHASRQVGAVEHVHALSVDYAREREQFGRPIGSFQAVAHALVRQLELVELSRTALRAAVCLEDSPQFVDAAFAARVAANDAAGGCSRIAHQTLGAIGVTQEHSLAGFTLRLAAWRQELYPPRFWEQRLGERVGRAGACWWEHIGDGIDRIPQASRAE